MQLRSLLPLNFKDSSPRAE